MKFAIRIADVSSFEQTISLIRKELKRFKVEPTSILLLLIVALCPEPFRPMSFSFSGDAALARGNEVLGQTASLQDFLRFPLEI